LKRNVLITGASRGLGEAIAREFWKTGAHVLLTARGLGALEALRSELGQRVSIFAADLADAAAPEQIAAWAFETVPYVDVLVNNAAITGPIGKFWTNDAAAWEQTLRVNLLSPAALMRAVIPRMTHGGAIINLSGGGAAAPRANFSAYAAAKAALVRLSENIAVEAAEMGVRVNCIAPGVMNTELLRDVVRADAADAGEEFAKVEKLIVDGKTMDPAIPARLCVYLASEEARNVSGRLISAQWDPWARLHVFSDELQASDVYTLRRIVPKDRDKDWETA
jgi:3-oxoacyl-[acyl-carrier protein] reductase